MSAPALTHNSVFTPELSRKYFQSRFPGVSFNGQRWQPVKCPLHDDRTPSMSINVEDGVWRCHVCNVGGGILDLEEKLAKCDRETARCKVEAAVGELQLFRQAADIEAIYPYHDPQGRLLFQKVRKTAKRFVNRRPDGGAWIYNLDGLERKPLYRLPELLVANEVFVCEGEKDCDNVLAALSVHPLPEGVRIAATCNFDGAGKWSDHYSVFFAGKKVAVLADNDIPGAAHANMVAGALFPFAAGVKVINFAALPEHGDVSDFLENHNVRDLLALVRSIPTWAPPVEEEWRSLFHTFAEFQNAPPLRFAIEGFLQEAGVTLIGGLSGHGKTLIMLAMVRALLEQRPLFQWESFAVRRPAERVLYLIPESAISPFWSRIRLFHLEEHIQSGRLLCHTLSSKEPISLDDRRILKAAEGADIFLDTAVRFMEGAENATEDARRFAGNLFRLLEAGARTVCGAHHAPKGFEREDYMTLENILRGSGDIGAMLCCAWGLRQIDAEANRIYVQNVKARDFQPCEPFIIEGRPHLDQAGHFKMVEPPGFADSLSKYVKRKSGRPEMTDKPEKVAHAVALHDQGKSNRKIGRTLGVSEGTIRTWLKEVRSA